MQMVTRQAEQEVVQLNGKVKHLQQAIASAEQSMRAKDAQIADLHSSMTALDARKDNLQVRRPDCDACVIDWLLVHAACIF